MNQLNVLEKDLPEKIIKEIDNLNDQAWKIHITNPIRALELSTQAKKMSEKYLYQPGIAYGLRNMGVSNRYLSNLETALSESIQALDLFVEIGDKVGEAQANVSIGSIYYYMGNFERSLDYFLKGIKFNEETGNKEALAYAYNGAGYIYSMLGENSKGLDFLQKALSLNEEINGSYDLETSILDSIAVVYSNDGQLEKADETYHKCLRLSEEVGQNINIGNSHEGIGDILEKQNKLDQAKEHFLKSLTTRRQIGDKVGEAASLLHLGKLFLRQKNSEQARKYLEESLKCAEEVKAKAVIYEAHEALAELFEKQEDIGSFAFHYKLYHKYKSEVFKDEQESKQKYLAIQYDMEKLQKESEINRLTNVVMKEKNEELEKKTEELEQSYNNISILSKIGRDITSTLDLDTILNTVYENVNQLMDATIFGIGIYRHEEGCIDYRLSIEKGKRYLPYKKKMEDKNQLAVWCIENKKEVFINDNRTEFSKYINGIEYSVPESVILEDGSKPQNPNSIIYLPLQVRDGIVGLISVQSYKQNAYSQHHFNMLKTLASYTSAALYNARSYRVLQTALDELKVTQSQLIQSEKMASLGELTAGIAHEIQNPLNFVNNFSEVNKEMLEELKAERLKPNAERDESLQDELINDVIDNSEKINHHGKRADAIVKGMLQHSRKTSGQKEPTDINALADEYLRLSYHGLRAKDKTFNAEIKTDFDGSIGKINVIPQDIGRVLLNLFNNAFYAVTEQKNKNLISYEPTVSVSTKKSDNHVTITVSDNGSGIPQKVVDKIFQPFFTTKPTGEGTGLGLSLAYDIVKAHGGELKVESKEGKGSQFIIQFPVF